MRRALAIGAACAAAWSNARLLSLSAGRWDVPGFRSYVALWTTFLVVSASTVRLDLVRERLSPGPGARESLFVAALAAAGVWSMHLFVAGVDVGRLHWSDSVPNFLRTSGFVALAAFLALLGWASRSNPFFSSVIRIQHERGHRVVSSGPYRCLRHPGYAAAIGIVLSSGLTLGSWASLLPSGLAISLLLRRIGKEEAVLRDELPGYEAYVRAVPYRLLPRVW